MKPIKSLIVLLFLLSESCERDNNNQNIKDDITIGDYSEMSDITIDTIISGPYLTELHLDIDGDSKNDIGFRCGYVKGLPSGGSYSYSEAMSLNKNTSILGFYSTDTTFLNRQTYVDNSESLHIQITEYYNHTCHRIDGKDTIQQINFENFRILPKDKDSKISNSDTFRVDTIEIMKSRVVHSYVYSSNDSTINYVDIYLNDCHSFPQNEIKYIGIKLVNDKGEKIGWIKVCALDIDKILILESAIQK